MDVCFCVDSRWLKYAAVASASVRKHNPRSVIYIVTDSEETVYGCVMVPMPEMDIIKGKGGRFTDEAVERKV